MPKGDTADVILGGTVLAAGSILAGKAAYDQLKGDGYLTDEESARILEQVSDPVAKSDDALERHIQRRSTSKPPSSD